MNRIEIPLSKRKIFLLVGGSIIFVVLGFHLFTTIAEQQHRYPPTFVKGIGILSMVLFTATGIYGLQKLFDKEMGLIVDEQGIYDNSNASSVGRIDWANIEAIRMEKIASTKFILVYTSNPETYLEHATRLKRKLLKANINMYGTPISITATALQCDMDSLEKTLNEWLSARKALKNVSQ